MVNNKYQLLIIIFFSFQQLVYKYCILSFLNINKIGYLAIN